jgi:outer membrane protein TolC
MNTFRLCLSIMLSISQAGTLKAQLVDFNEVVQPVDVKALDLSEYLVQLAWLNQPQSAAAQEEMLQAMDEARVTGKEWMRDVQATVNINEANINGPDDQGNVFYPRYNLGINLNLYNILSQKPKNDVQKRDITIASHEINQRKLEIRAETLTRYQRFKLMQELVKTRTLVEQESYNNFVLIQQLYKNDERTFEDYSSASTMYYQAQEARIRSESDQLIAKYQLEAMIGIRWEQVQHPEK